MDGEESVDKQKQTIAMDAWRRLYSLAAQVRAMEPWLWMEETDVFGVQDTHSDEILFLSVMGLLGEYHAVAVYPGLQTLAEFWQMQNAKDQERIADMLSGIKHVHAAFGRKSDLKPEEKRLTASLGLTFKGAYGWPYFRSFRPGWFPWTVDAQEAQWLTLALAQLLEVAPRIQKDRRLLGTGGADRLYLVRVSTGQENQLVWHDTQRACPPKPVSLPIAVANASLDAVRAMTPSEMTVELDVVPSYTAIGQKHERPQSPFMMMAVESKSGFILGVEMLPVEGPLHDMWARVPGMFLEMLKRSQVRPVRLALRTPWLLMVMHGLCEELKIKVKSDPDLRAWRTAQRGFRRFMQQ